MCWYKPKSCFKKLGPKELKRKEKKHRFNDACNTPDLTTVNALLVTTLIKKPSHKKPCLNYDLIKLCSEKLSQATAPASDCDHFLG